LIIYLFLIGSILYVNSVDYAFNNFLKPHQKERIDILLGFKTDFHGTGYNVNQAIISVGSGGFSGKGFLQGTQTKFKFVPKQSSDFIFCTVGEEWGFLGSGIVIGIFLFLLLRLISLAERQRSVFSRIYGYCVVSILFTHFFLNIGMAIGLVPVIGIPLPFLSYGGSSLWGFTILLFIFLRLDASRTEYLV
jgi:rod shape determining protein RodA